MSLSKVLEIARADLGYTRITMPIMRYPTLLHLRYTMRCIDAEVLKETCI